jgi:IclR family pca regulon transcriptional regulator
LAQSPYTIEALLRGLQVLSLFNRETPTLSLTQITDAASLNKTTTFRILSTLESAGFLERDDETKRFRPGLKVLQLGFTAISSLEFRQVARPYLERLSNEVGQTVSLSILDGMDVVYIDRVRQQQVIGVMLGLGSRIPAHCASLGKAILAFLPPKELRSRLEEAAFLKPHTPKTITDRASLEADLEQVRERGYSINDEEWVLGLRSTAAPILDDNGWAVGAVNISVSAAEVSRQQLESQLSPAIRNTARQISGALGYPNA